MTKEPVGKARDRMLDVENVILCNMYNKIEVGSTLSNARVILNMGNMTISVGTSEWSSEGI